MTRILVNNRYLIDDQEAKPAFNQPPALAYAVYRPHETESVGFALVCDPKAPPRLSMISRLQQLVNRHMILIYESAIIEWPLEKRHCPVVIFEKAAGPKLFKTPASIIRPLPEEIVIKNFVSPIATMLNEMHESEIFHRMIRADNIFYEDQRCQDIILGECISSPPGLAQPAIYETIENCLSIPAGRYTNAQSDFYMLGVTLVSLLTGQVPLANLSDEEVTKLKLAKGSYSTLANHERISHGMMELLRGILNDNPNERWTGQMVMDWADGRRQTPKQPHLPVKASRSLRFAGHDYYTTLELAKAFHHYWDQAIALVRTNAVSTWIRRHLDNADLLVAYQNAAGGNFVMENADYDRALARIIIALDPNGPLRFRELSIHIGAIPNFLSMYLKDNEARELLKTSFNAQLPQFQAAQPELQARLFRDAMKFERFRIFAGRSSMGQGLERIAYEFVPDLPCLSPLLEREFVLTIEDLVPALDRVCADKEIKILYLIDRDIAAFLVARTQRNAMENEVSIFDNGIDSDQGRLAQVRFYSSIQNKFNEGKPFFDLCNAAAALIEPCIDRYHSRDTRKQVAEKLKRAARTGILSELILAIDSKQELRNDDEQFQIARIDHAHNIYKLVIHLQDITNKSMIAASIGSKISSVISSGLAIFVIILGSILFIL